MAKARAVDRRRKAIRNIRKITRTMELISRAQFKRAMDRATAATAYTQRITALVRDLARTGGDSSAAGAPARDAPCDPAGAVGQSGAVRRVQRQRAPAGVRATQGTP